VWKAKKEGLKKGGKQSIKRVKSGHTEKKRVRRCEQNPADRKWEKKKFSPVQSLRKLKKKREAPEKTKKKRKENRRKKKKKHRGPEKWIKKVAETKRPKKKQRHQL